MLVTCEITSRILHLVWVPQNEKDVGIVEGALWRATKIKGTDHMSLENQLGAVFAKA